MLNNAALNFGVILTLQFPKNHDKILFGKLI